MSIGFCFGGLQTFGSKYKNARFDIRNTSNSQINTGLGEVENNELFVIFPDGTEEKIVSSVQTENIKTTIGGINNPTFSIDSTKVFFLSSGFVTSDIVYSVDLRTKAVIFVTDGNSLSVITTGKYRGKLLVSKHKYHGAPNYGSYDHYFIVSENGREIRDVGENETGW